jgi:hypothetical protein
LRVVVGDDLVDHRQLLLVAGVVCPQRQLSARGAATAAGVGLAAAGEHDTGRQHGDSGEGERPHSA